MSNMSNMNNMTPGRIIAIAIGASFAINGVAVTFTLNAINRQEIAVAELTKIVYTKLDDRYRRFEANAAHNSLKDRIKATEKWNDKLEAKMDSLLK